MRRVLPTAADEINVHAFFADGWLDRGGIRVNFVASADGAVQVDGISAGLQTPGDNRVFAALRDLADVVLAGAGTVRAENYRPVVLSDRRRALRREYGLADQPPVAVISRSLDLDPRSSLFVAPTPAARTLVITCAAAPAAARHELERVADVLVCGDERVDLAAARCALQQRGLTRILSEGGPHAFAALVRAGVADELCLSLVPRLVGPGPLRVTAGLDRWPDPQEMTLVGALEEDGALFLRYRIPDTPQ